MTATRRILLVEDDPTMRSLLVTLLKLEKHEVIICDEFQENSILSLIESKKPEMIIMDVTLKSINGLNVLAKIREISTYQSIRILMASGYDLEQECIQAGADGFLLKPYMPSDLINWINQS